MSQQYPGGFITKANVDPTSSSPLSPAPGVWTLDQQLQYKQAGVWPSYAVNAIEDVFSTYLYTGNGSTQTITNNIDLSGQGGLVWMKGRSGATDHALYDTARGATFDLASNTSAAQTTQSTGLTSFGSTGFSIGALAKINTNAATYASWTFREQAKFFDVVTYTGNGVAGRTVSHNLGSVPGCIIVKRTDTTADWEVYHRGLDATQPEKYQIYLNATNARQASTTRWNDTAPTATQFTLGTWAGVNANGGTYVAYLFAHDAGGFGPNNTDNVISCGSFSTNASGAATVTLGYEPQWVLWKAYSGTTGTSDWDMFDNMRGYCVPGASNDKRLQPNSSGAEGTVNVGGPTATGFTVENLNATSNYIYIAIRRGPMRPPTTGTSVFSPNATTATTGTVITPNFPVDAQIIQYRTPAGGNILWQDRLRGVNTTTTENNNPVLTSNDTSAESNTFASTRAWSNTGFQICSGLSGQDRIYWSFRRAPGFFDVVCYTGTGSGSQTISHNLGVVPELTINKSRSLRGWTVYYNNSRFLRLNDVTAGANESLLNPTATTFVANAAAGFGMNAAENYVTYLFATLPGVSKVGMYTGTGALQTINCGFTSGARFVLIKRNDSTGDWWVYDSARGITSGNDPYLFLNSTAAEVTGTNYVDTTSVGFQVTAAAPAGLNANGGTYIFLAIA